MKILQAIPVAVSVADGFKVPGVDKKKAAIEGVQTTLMLAEYVSDKDLLNDAEVLNAIGAAIDAEVAARKTYDALHAAVEKAKAARAGK